MSSMDDRQNSTPGGKKLISGTFRLPGLVSQMSPVEQLPFPNAAQTPTPPTGTPLPSIYQTPASPTAAMTVPLLDDPAAASVPSVTQQLPGDPVSPAVTRQLTDVAEAQTGALLVPLRTNTTTSLRQPVVIRGTGKKRTETLRPPRGRRWVVHIAVTSILVLIVLGSVLSVLPTSNGGATPFNPFRPILNLVKSNSSNPALIAAQAATATAVIVHQDGYDPGQSTGLPPPQTGNGSTLNRFAFGQCTYWANMRYHALTGYWVPWLGNAYQWVYGAPSAGWVVSATPKVPSIIVLQPYVQGASGYGHVAIVERINPDGSVYTSNYNWYAGGGWDTLSYWTFRPGPGVSFVWHP
jgi:surface antigen